jgi:hypothetical protein
MKAIADLPLWAFVIWTSVAQIAALACHYLMFHPTCG